VNELDPGEIGVYIIFTVRAIGWALQRAGPSAGKTGFHSLLKDKAIITIMPISDVFEVLSAILKDPGTRA